MNVHESEKLAKILELAGFKKEDDKENIPDIIIFNTCCIRDTAEQKITGHICETKKLKKTKPDLIIAVIGCLGARGTVKADIVLGTNELDNFIKLLFEKTSSPYRSGFDFKLGIGNSIVITHGCDNFCSYCIVPYVRGKEFSRNICDIEKEFKDITAGKNGVIYLLGQNVNSYKCPQTGAGFVSLLERLCKITPPNVKINFLSAHPKDFSAELIGFIAEHTQIERNIHLPMQSGSNKILALMNRKYTAERYTEKINLLREKVPGVHITTDIICGFPGETEEDFAKTAEVLKNLQFSAAFIFPYHRRSGTAADLMGGQLDMQTKKCRATELIRLQREISRTENFDKIDAVRMQCKEYRGEKL
jgi:tRNA-2-methylthio-N6-dimethylallyladenosine synthase